MPPRDSLMIDPAFGAALRGRGLDSLTALMDARGDADLHKPGLDGWRSRAMLELDGRRFYLKRYVRPPLREQLVARRGGFEAVAAVEWRWMQRLRAIGLPVPHPVACGWRRGAGRESFSVLVTAAVPGRSLERWVGDADGAAVREDASGGAACWLNDAAYRAAVAEALAALVRRLHGAGLFHRDLYLSHIFLDPRRAPAEALTLIDLQRVMRPRAWRRRRWMVKDLAALNYSTPPAAASRATRLRWYMRYRGIERLTRADKALLRRIADKTRRIARHDARRGR